MKIDYFPKASPSIEFVSADTRIDGASIGPLIPRLQCADQILEYIAYRPIHLHVSPQRSSLTHELYLIYTLAD